MIYLGLGSNMGDRVGMLRRALRELMTRKVIQAPIRVSSLYLSDALLPENAPASWAMDFLNLVVEAKTDLEPQNLLREIKKIEADLGRKSGERWAPRKIDIDYLMDDRSTLNLENLKLPHPEIKNRDFVFLPLRELGVELPGDLKQESARVLPTKVFSSELMGVINVTPDSFSDGNQYFQLEAALQRIDSLVEEGASIIDLGAESTRPDAVLLTAQEEWRRLEAVLQEIARRRSEKYPWIKFSLDCRQPENIERALDLKIDWINDVSAGADPRSLDILQSCDRDFVWMHHLSIPADRSKILPLNCDPVEEVLKWGAAQLNKLAQAGIDVSRCILDPGIGFGKNPRQSLELIHRAKAFEAWNCRVLYGHSRKSFLQLISHEPPQFRDAPTAWYSAYLMHQGVDYLRVHSVITSRQAIQASLLAPAF